MQIVFVDSQLASYLTDRGGTYVLRCMDGGHRKSLSLTDRLNQIIPRVTSESFLSMRGLATK